MIIIAELIDVFKEYRNGNKEIFDTLYRDKIETKTSDNGEELIYQGSSLVINDEGLNNHICTMYDKFSKPYKYEKDSVCPKYYEQVYNGSKQDLKLDAITVLYRLFNNSSFNPVTSEEIYAVWKYEMITLLNDNIKFSALAKSDRVYDEDEQEEYTLIDKQSMDNRFDIEITYDYVGVVAEVKRFLPNIKKLLQKGADTQCQIIDLICKYYDYSYNAETDTFELPTQEHMIEYYKKEYGKTISQPRYSQILNSIFNVMADCTLGLKGKCVEREQFIKSKGSNNDLQELQ
ncbi:MAG: hypothetical protein IJC04_06850 [Oscillospiraceae bacterium]|nr:hypothetical protein [Oscillospiraceae bacterium]